MATRIAVDHIEVRRLLADLTGSDPDAALVELESLLPDHFAFEERPGGFFERMVELGHDPQTAERLIADHAGILEDLAAARNATGEDFTQRVRALAKRLKQHEWDEARYGSSSPGLTSPRSRYPEYD